MLTEGFEIEPDISVFEVETEDFNIELEISTPTIELHGAGKIVVFTQSDIQIIQDVGDTRKVFSKTGDLVTGIAYDDAAGATNHSKTFVWTTVNGDDAVYSIIEIFTYDSQVWTYTKLFTYPTSDPAAPTITPSLTKV